MQNEPRHEHTQTEDHRAGLLIRLLLPAMVLVAGAAIAFWLLQSGPKAKPRPKARNAVMVDVRPVEYGLQTTTISIMGTVRPKHEVVLKPEVTGKVIAMSPDLLPGGRIAAGAPLLEIDPSNYQLAVRQLVSEVAKAEAALQLELGRQRVARKEYELLGEEVAAEELELMLRTPQLESARATLEGIKTQLEKARLDLERTRVTAPFNAVVMTRDVNLGTSVSPSTALATLVDTDAYWVEAPIPVSQLKWIAVGGQQAGKSARARVYDTAAWGEGLSRSGTTAGLTARVEEQGRMAQVLVEIKDPLALQKGSAGQPQLLLDSYVRVELEGETLSDAARIERDLVRDGDRVWIMDKEDLLDIRTVEIAFRARDHVLVTGGLSAGERLVTSNLPSPVQGMQLRLRAKASTPDDAGDTRL